MPPSLQRVPLKDRWPLAEALAEAKIDANDPMLPLMTWYGIEPLAGEDAARVAQLAARCKLPLLRNYVARRAVTADAGRGMSALLPAIEGASDDVRRDLLAGILDALRGRKHVPRPEGWPATFAKLLTTRDPDLLEQTLLLALDLGEPKAIETLRAGRRRSREPARHANPRPGRAGRAARARPGARALQQLDDRSLRGPAIRALAAYDDPATPQEILETLSGAHGVRARRCDRHAVRAAGVGPGLARRGRQEALSPAAT